MKRITNNRRPRRKLIGFEPSGPVAEMVQFELRSGLTKTRLMEDCIVKALGAKYPKLACRYWILREELEL